MRNVTFDFSDQTVVVTGASSGIGRQIALEFGDSGATVINADVQEQPKDIGEELPTHEKIAKNSGRAEYVETDVSDPDDIAAVVEAARAHGGVDVMVNNAGIFRPDSIRDVDIEEVRQMLEVNINGALLGIQAAANDMIERDVNGTIINIASMSSIVAQRSMVGYNATKGAVRMATLCSALDLADYGIRVNAVGPGSILTEIIEGQTEDLSDNPTPSPDIPLGREGRPEDIPGAVLFLASEAADYITGEVVYVDGGARIQ